jgi:hypothetical protein
MIASDAMRQIEHFQAEGGDTVMLSTDGSRWEIARHSSDGAELWREWSVDGTHPFNEEEARAEFERWRA